MKDLSRGKMHISNIVVIAIGSLMLAAGVLAAATKSKGRRTDHSYRAKKPLSNNEQAMYWKLVAALPNQVVMAQVGMGTFVQTESQSARGTIGQKSVDFLVCDKSFNVIAAIEIDDKTHERADRKKADQTKNSALARAGIKLIRWKSTKLPDVSEIVRDVLGESNEKREVLRRVSDAKQPEERQPDRSFHGVAKRDGNKLPERPTSNG